ncbi:FeoC-like transcriptional regulator [Corynebacterium sp. H128]|uniref:FeoC-like transcriptional regulator n=1 Tax=unclassified Corynebacterium TaxID=2624378 RepID=UPI0030AF430C
MTPTELVRNAILAGCASREEISRRSGLGAGTVELVMENLERSGGLVRETLSSCSASGCGSCGQSTGCSGAAGVRGPVLLKLVKPQDRA